MNRSKQSLENDNIKLINQMSSSINDDNNIDDISVETPDGDMVFDVFSIEDLDIQEGEINKFAGISLDPENIQSIRSHLTEILTEYYQDVHKEARPYLVEALVGLYDKANSYNEKGQLKIQHPREAYLKDNYNLRWLVPVINDKKIVWDNPTEETVGIINKIHPSVVSGDTIGTAPMREDYPVSTVDSGILSQNGAYQTQPSGINRELYRRDLYHYSVTAVRNAYFEYMPEVTKMEREESKRSKKAILPATRQIMSKVIVPSNRYRTGYDPNGKSESSLFNNIAGVNYDYEIDGERFQLVGFYRMPLNKDISRDLIVDLHKRKQREANLPYKLYRIGIDQETDGRKKVTDFSEKLTRALTKAFPEMLEILLQYQKKLVNRNSTAPDIMVLLRKYGYDNKHLTPEVIDLINKIVVEAKLPEYPKSDKEYKKSDKEYKKSDKEYKKSDKSDSIHCVSMYPADRIKYILKDDLDMVAPYYGRYPYYAMDIDSDLTRLYWINQQIDNGEIFYFLKTIREKVSKTSKGVNKPASLDEPVNLMSPYISLNKTNGEYMILDPESRKYYTREDYFNLLTYRANQDLIQSYESSLKYRGKNTIEHLYTEAMSRQKSRNMKIDPLTRSDIIPIARKRTESILYSRLLSLDLGNPLDVAVYLRLVSDSQDIRLDPDTSQYVIHSTGERVICIHEFKKLSGTPLSEILKQYGQEIEDSYYCRYCWAMIVPYFDDLIKGEGGGIAQIRTMQDLPSDSEINFITGRFNSDERQFVQEIGATIISYMGLSVSVINWPEIVEYVANHYILNESDVKRPYQYVYTDSDVIFVRNYHSRQKDQAGGFLYEEETLKKEYINSKVFIFNCQRLVVLIARLALELDRQNLVPTTGVATEDIIIDNCLKNDNILRWLSSYVSIRDRADDFSIDFVKGLNLRSRREFRLRNSLHYSLTFNNVVSLPDSFSKLGDYLYNNVPLLYEDMSQDPKLVSAELRQFDLNVNCVQVSYAGSPAQQNVAHYTESFSVAGGKYSGVSNMDYVEIFTTEIEVRKKMGVKNECFSSVNFYLATANSTFTERNIDPSFFTIYQDVNATVPTFWGQGVALNPELSEPERISLVNILHAHEREVEYRPILTSNKYDGFDAPVEFKGSLPEAEDFMKVLKSVTDVDELWQRLNETGIVDQPLTSILTTKYNVINQHIKMKNESHSRLANGLTKPPTNDNIFGETDDAYFASLKDFISIHWTVLDTEVPVDIVANKHESEFNDWMRNATHKFIFGYWRQVLAIFKNTDDIKIQDFQKSEFLVDILSIFEPHAKQLKRYKYLFTYEQLSSVEQQFPDHQDQVLNILFYGEILLNIFWLTGSRMTFADLIQNLKAGTITPLSDNGQVLLNLYATIYSLFEQTTMIDSTDVNMFYNKRDKELFEKARSLASSKESSKKNKQRDLYNRVTPDVREYTVHEEPEREAEEIFAEIMGDDDLDDAGEWPEDELPENIADDLDYIDELDPEGTYDEGNEMFEVDGDYSGARYDY